MNASTKSLCACLWLPLTMTAMATEPDLRYCRSLAEPQQRLTCYDSIPLPAAAPAGALTAATAAAAAKPTTPAVPTASSADRYGLPVAVPTEAEPDFIESQIIGAFDGWGPRSVFTLANGQRWRVTDGTEALYRLQDPKVRVRRGVLGAFYLEIPGTNINVRVRRLP